MTTRPCPVRLTLLCVPATAALRAGCFPADEAPDTAALAPLAPLAALTTASFGPLDHVVASPMASARATTQALGLSGDIDAALREVDYGRWAGKSLKEVAVLEADALAAWLADPAMHGHGGESLQAVSARAGQWLARRAPGHTLAVTHASVIRALVAHALGAPTRAAMQIDIAPLTLTTLTTLTTLNTLTAPPPGAGPAAPWRVTSVAAPVH